MSNNREVSPSASTKVEEPVKPSEIPLPDLNALRKVAEGITDKQKVDLINEHMQAAGKILLLAYHTANLNHGINGTLVANGERYSLRFERIDSPLTEENTKVKM